MGSSALLKDAHSLAIFVAIRSFRSTAPINIRALVIYGGCMHANNCNFLSSRVHASSHKRLHISEMEHAIGIVLNTAIAIFAKNPMQRVFPNLVTNVPKFTWCRVIICSYWWCTIYTLTLRIGTGTPTLEWFGNPRGLQP